MLVKQRKSLTRHGFITKPTLFAFAVRWGETVRRRNGKNSKMQSWENFRHKLDCNYWQVNNVFWQAIQPHRGKRSHNARSIKDQNGVLLRNEKYILGRWRECRISKIFLSQALYYITGHTRGTSGEGKYHHCNRSPPCWKKLNLCLRENAFNGIESTVGLRIMRNFSFGEIYTNFIEWFFHQQLTTAYTKKELAAYANAGSIVEEVISAIRTVVAFGCQHREVER